MTNTWEGAPHFGICKAITTYAYQENDWKKVDDFFIIADIDSILVMIGILLILIIYYYFSMKRKKKYVDKILKGVGVKNKMAAKNVKEKTYKSFIKKVVFAIIFVIIIIFGLLLGQLLSSMGTTPPEESVDTYDIEKSNNDFKGYFKKDTEDKKTDKDYQNILNF